MLYRCWAPWQNGLVERHGGIWNAAARKTIEDVSARRFVDMRRLASMIHKEKNARINSSCFSDRRRIQALTVFLGQKSKVQRSRS